MSPGPGSITAAPESMQRAFRSAMSNVTTAVAVVTTQAGPAPHGTTVSAFASLSLDPVLILVSLDNRSQLLAQLSVGQRVGLSVLASHQDQVALRFAQKGEHKFADIAWSLVDGAPRLDDAHAWVAFDVDQLVPAGDHTLVIGAVRAAEATLSGAPLTYYQSTFGTHKVF